MNDVMLRCPDCGSEKWPVAMSKAEADSLTRAALIAVVREYGQHKDDCELVECRSGRVDVDTPDERAAICTCGFDAALVEAAR